MLNLLKEKK
ncbi:hypothetical protein [Plasmodium yoelii yoelii]|uniref:Uncharacterized protein n=1 Tax=Plasmodium yoelii yoelii TaxID=73239 RepID=Q7RDA8_PLAYO|nr:hypothetical protein [Plasmodium yoelii yoelii]